MSWFEDGPAQIYFEVAGDGEALLLLPGLFGSIEELLPLREALVAAGYKVIAADLPGSGRSTPQPRQYTATYLKDDACSFMALLAQIGVESAHLMGFSDGGEISLLMAALKPEMARSVVTWGAAAQISDPGGHLREAMATLIDNPIPPMQGYRQHLVETYGEANARAMTQSAASAFNDIVNAGGDISLSMLGKVKCPVLLIRGEDDFLVAPALLTEAATGIQSVEVLTVKNAGHDVHLSHADWLDQTILAWLREH